MYFLLFYDYVENVLDRRVRYREGHLALVKQYVERSVMPLAGAFADPVDGAVLVFKVDSRDSIEAFVREDPYVTSGLVTGYRIREWTVVAGTAL